MKRLSLFEITIIGFLVSIVLSTGIIYLVGNDSYIAETVTIITLRPIFEHFFPISPAYSLYGSFLFLVIVFTVYSTVIGLILQRARKTLVIGGLAVLLIALGIDQKIGMEKYATQTATASHAITYTTQTKPVSKQTEKQYFGKEATGDLNNDGKNDVAFIIPRNDKETGGKTAYYLSAAVTIPEGKQGTNLLFLGADVVPETISIDEGEIIIVYTDTKKSAETKITASFENGVLVKN